MKLIFRDPSESLADLKDTEQDLPNFCLITGVNGTGKTHLLKNINNGHITVENNDNRAKLSFYTNYSDLKTREPQKANFEDVKNFIKLRFNEYKGINFKQKKESFGKNLQDWDKYKNQAGHFVYNTVAKRAKKDITELSEHDFKLFCAETHPGLKFRFLFYQYQYLFNKYIRALNSERDSNKKFLTDAEFIETHGKAPWVSINDTLNKFKDFNYVLKFDDKGIFSDFTNDANLDLILKHKTEDLELRIDDLSSGEEVMFFLAKVVSQAQILDDNDNRNSIFLLDEIDAGFHPSLSEILIKTLTQEPFNKHKVILTTHSPSTVAYAPEKSIFVMTKENSRITSQTKSEAIAILSDGIISISDEKANMIIDDTIREQEKPILLVEGHTDKMILETAWNKIYGKTCMPFYMQDFFDCNSIINLFLRGNIFTNYSNRVFIGLLDFDDAYKIWKEKCKDKFKIDNLIRCSPNQIVYTNNNLGYILPIPVPKIRKNYANQNMRNSYLSIELLFEDKEIESFCKKQEVAGGVFLNIFKTTRKIKFAKEVVPNFEKEKFKNFKPLFEIIKSILETVENQNKNYHSFVK